MHQVIHFPIFFVSTNPNHEDHPSLIAIAALGQVQAQGTPSLRGLEAQNAVPSKTNPDDCFCRPHSPECDCKRALEGNDNAPAWWDPTEKWCAEHPKECVGRALSASDKAVGPQAVKGDAAPQLDPDLDFCFIHPRLCRPTRIQSGTESTEAASPQGNADDIDFCFRHPRLCTPF